MTSADVQLAPKTNVSFPAPPIRLSVPAPDVIESSAAGGVVVQGVIPSRPNDLVSVAVSSVSLAAGRETAFELLYKVAVLESTMWLLDVQYISRVAGIRSANGWVATTRLSIQL